MHYNKKRAKLQIILLLHLRDPQVYKEDSWSFSLSSPGFCFGVLICLFRSQRMSLCVLARALLLIPTAHLGNDPQLCCFFPPSLSFFKALLLCLFSSKYLSHPFCPSCPLARSEVETCVSLHLHGREREKK